MNRPGNHCVAGGPRGLQLGRRLKATLQVSFPRSSLVSRRNLLGQGRYAEAEPLLRAWYEGMKARGVGLPPLDRVRHAEATDRLARLCEATGRPKRRSGGPSGENT